MYVYVCENGITRKSLKHVIAISVIVTGIVLLIMVLQINYYSYTISKHL